MLDMRSDEQTAKHAENALLFDDKQTRKEKIV